MTEVTIKRSNLDQFFYESDDTVNFLDIETGKPLIVAFHGFHDLEEFPNILDMALDEALELIKPSRFYSMELEDALRIEMNPDHYLELPRLGGSIFDYEIVSDFAETVTDTHLQQLLNKLCDSWQGIQYVDDRLENIPDMYDRWLNFKWDRQQAVFEEWLNKRGYRATFV